MHTALRRVHTSNVMLLSRTSPHTKLIPPRCGGYALLGSTYPSPSQQRSIPTSLLRVRHFHLASWKNFFRQKDNESSGMSDTQEEIAKAAILEKVMKGRQLTDLMLRCTILDHAGNIKNISGQFKRSDLCNEHRLNVRRIMSAAWDSGWTLAETLMKPRDLRKIDSRIPNLVPTILIRKGAVLINMLHIRALVKADTVVLFDSYGSNDSRLHSVFLYHLEHNLKARGSGAPYEFRAIESILLSVLSALEAEMVFIRNLVGGLLAELEDDINHDKFKRLLHYSRRLVAFKNRAKLVQEALEEVLEQDDDLDAMYLTDKKNGVARNMHEHEELEVLLEFFSKQVEEIANEAENIEANVQSTQEIVELILDSNRNALLALDLKVSIGTMGIGTGALIAGLFGMNLKSHMEEMPYAFMTLCTLSSAVALFVAWAGLRRLAQIRKVGLSNPKRVQDLEVRPRIPLPLRRRSSNGWS
ncbi:cora-domain-containing protein [Suillus paluster]|uniref:cora-domain-containing protein n=1 Tax=Suillus paluster TaxID=48578 RepID=UPI001B867E09|nr:cora-domain-containing protein [Suillus paluster]KAG1741539.1 cora-domain-containing protein [Suillus paluster]